MIRITRRGVAVAGSVVVAAVLAVVLLIVFWPGDPHLSGSTVIDSTLPTEKDVPGYLANAGIEGVLTAPPGAKDGRAVLAGAELAQQCQIYQKQGTGWACQGLQGLGVVGFENANNVDSRISSFVLAYGDDHTATAAWTKMAGATRGQLPDAQQQPNSGLGDQSQTFVTDAGTTVVLRIGSVVALAMSYSDMGYLTSTEPYGEPVNPDETDPIQMWSTLQAAKIKTALGGP